LSGPPANRRAILVCSHEFPAGGETWILAKG